MSKNDFSNIEEYIQELIANSKGDYINQTVSFKKDNEFHMDLLRFVLANSRNISAFYRHLIKDKMQDSHQKHTISKEIIQNTHIEESPIPLENTEIPIRRIEKPPVKLILKEESPKKNEHSESPNIQGFF